MSELGYIAISRGFFGHEVFKKEAFTEREAFQWLIMEAAWKARRVRRGVEMISLERGQLSHSLEFMRRAWQWASKSRVSAFLARLEREAMIATDKEHQTLRVTVCNYDIYQRKQDDRKTKNETATERGKDELEPINHSTNNQKEGYTPDDFETAVGAYNLSAGRTGWPVAQNLTESRKTKLRGRLGDCGGLEGWTAALARAEASDFLAGRVSRGEDHANWTPNLDFFLQAKSFTKLIEGGYDNRSSAAAKTHWQQSLEQLGKVADRLGGDRDGEIVSTSGPRLRLISSQTDAG